ncbi:PREDICTED: uncharacterized protein LOC106102878 isoform X2 [Papilio polytes]|uniref:uncharacterized protein LOC106102878 isoform X2 n=1 Tax=Papilio polytes TaxID=76194 RepID=UPI0006763446|nr:PREDICTED: uncharacterized protein LOC106102878 isoform X2 [Papilio polytes]
MQWFLAVLLCSATLAVGSELPDLLEANPSVEVQCLAGTEWKSNCHSCRCLSNGNAECSKEELCDISITADPIPCKPHTVFSRDCSSCICLPNGKAQCTQAVCNRSNIPKKSELLSGKECSPGSKWSSQCNECHCTSEGYSSCTEMKCPGQENEATLRCAPDSVWMNECNTCWCTTEGRAMCTRMGCMGLSAINFNEDTTPEPIETNVLRSDAKKENSTKAVICSANRMFIKDCNTCWCNEDGTSYFCTRKVCVLEVPDENTEELSEKGDSFAERKDKVSLRKRRAVPTQEPPKACQPGQEFRIDCNKCLCNNEGHDFSCTRIDCAMLNNNNNGGVRTKRDATEEITTNCTAGTAFQRSCNICLCGADGQRATCTTQDCEQRKTNDGVHAPETDPNFRCNPGEQFKRECNDCTCSADGKSIFCTLRYCSVYTP